MADKPGAARLSSALVDLAAFAAVLAVGAGLAALGYAFSQFAGDVCLLSGTVALILYCFHCGRREMGGGGLLVSIFLVVGMVNIYFGTLWYFVLWFRTEGPGAESSQWDLFSMAYQMVEVGGKAVGVIAFVVGLHFAPGDTPDGAPADSH